MKRGIWLGGIALLLVGLLIGWAIGGNKRQTNQPDPAHIITVSGGATVSSAPDEAIVRLGVRTENADSQQALQANTQKANDVMKALAAAGIAAKDIQTTQVSLNPHVQNRGTPRETKTYVADNEVAVTVHDLTKVGQVVSSSVGAGANVVGGIEFQLSDLSKSRQDALAKAIVAARAKAEALATAAGTSLGAVVRIDEQNTQTRPQFDRSFSDAVTAGLAVPSPAPVSPQQVQTEVTVTVVWSLN
jgi:uncharacterized protein YggE